MEAPPPDVIVCGGGPAGMLAAALGTVLSGRPIARAPLPVRLLDRWPLLRRIPGRIIGHGLRRERVRSPKA